MKNLAMEWGRFGIRSNSIAPGPIEDTEGMLQSLQFLPIGLSTLLSGWPVIRPGPAYVMLSRFSAKGLKFLQARNLTRLRSKSPTKKP